MARYLVTGGAGFIGSNLVLALTSRGERVRVLDCLKSSTFDTILNQPNGHLVEVVQGDIRDEKVLSDAMKGIEIVHHFAAEVSVPQSIKYPILTDQVNSQGTLMVLEAARSSGVRRVVYAASSAAYGDGVESPKHEGLLPRPLSPYATSKLAGEYHLRSYSALYGLETISLRFFNVFGPGQQPTGAYAAAVPKFLWSIINGDRLPVYGDGNQTRDFVYIDNVVHANLLAATSPQKLSGEVVNVANGRSVSLNEVLDYLRKKICAELQVDYLPERVGDVRHSAADISKIQTLLGYQPLVSWQDGILPTYEYLVKLAKKARA
jgi:UDP-glucose 4-epimerase